MKLFYFLLIALGLTVLSGCADFVRGFREGEERYAQEQKLAAENTCRQRYGLKEGSDTFTLCVIQLVEGQKTKEHSNSLYLANELDKIFEKKK
jgi:hypothetical protein